MSDAHDPAALVRHAVQAGDWRLVELIRLMISGHPSASASAGRRAYATLGAKLGLSGNLGDYHRD